MEANSRSGLSEEIGELVQRCDVVNGDSAVLNLITAVEISDIDVLGPVAESGL